MTVAIIIAVLGGSLGYFRWMGHKSQNMEFGPSPEWKTELPVCPESPPNCARAIIDITNVDSQNSAKMFNSIVGYLDGHEFKRIFLEPNFAHYTYESTVFGFTDDIFVLVKENLIQIRSASRVGYSDLGVNRKRIDSILKFVGQNNHSKN